MKCKIEALRKNLIGLYINDRYKEVVDVKCYGDIAKSFWVRFDYGNRFSGGSCERNISSREKTHPDDYVIDLLIKAIARRKGKDVP